ncbi:MAG: bacterial regulatory, tetR family protein [Bradyrhizobium sp.]|nr:bacterial regulatory, tetR family protein [Bradyrhizobium sp.]
MVGSTKQLMIERTAMLLARKGLQGTSFADVLEASGAPRGSLYHHFPGGKSELVLAAVTAAGQFVLDALDRTTGQPADEVADLFIGLWRGVLARSEFRGGCAVAAVTVAADVPELVEWAASIFRSWRTELAARLSAGGVPQERAIPISAILVAACEGAVLMARAEQSFAPFDLVAVEQIAIVRAAMTLPMQD